MGNRPFSDSTSALSFLCYAPSLKQAGPPASQSLEASALADASSYGRDSATPPKSGRQ